MSATSRAGRRTKVAYGVGSTSSGLTTSRSTSVATWVYIEVVSNLWTSVHRLETTSRIYDRNWVVKRSSL